jgi:hypothetical protein
MDEATFLRQVLGLLNSITSPLLSSLILIDNLINEVVDNCENYGKILLIDEQVQSSIEYLLKLRTLTLSNLESQFISGKNTYAKA